MEVKELKEKILVDANGQLLNPRDCLIELGHLLYLDNDKKTLWACPIMKDDTLNREEVELCWYPMEEEGFVEYTKEELKRINKFFKTNFK